MPNLSPQSGLLIEGTWQQSAQREPVYDKFTGQEIGEVSIATVQDVERAVSGAHKEFLRGAPPPYERSEILKRAAILVGKHQEAFRDTMIAETGFTRSDVDNEIARCKQTLRLSGEEATRLVGEMVPLSGAPGQENRIGFTLRQPIGVVAAITPFNSPLNTVAHKVAPAIAAGNSVVLKPSTYTPLTASLLCQVLIEAGLPPGFVSLIHGDGSKVGTALASDERVRFIAFTGSTGVGRALQAIAGLRRTQMELGSIACTIVCADANVKRALPRILNASFRKAGQVCTSIQRLYVAAPLVGKVTEALADLLSKSGVGDPRGEGTLVGPMIAEKEAARAQSWCEEAVAAGARRIAGGKRERGLLWPTILTGVPPNSRAFRDEIFAPVVAIAAFEKLEDAIVDINATPYGLATGIFTQSIDAAFRAARALRVGSVHINETSSSRVDLMPYGGVKDSGFGHEGPRYAMREMTEERLITLSF